MVERVDFILGIKTYTNQNPVYANMLMSGNKYPDIKDVAELCLFINNETKFICDDIVYVLTIDGKIIWEKKDEKETVTEIN